MFRRLTLVFLVCLPLVRTPASMAADATPAVQAVVAGQTIDDELAPLQKRAYELKLTAGQYAEIALETAEPATLRLLGPGSFETTAIPDPDSTRLLVPMVASEEGTFHLDVQRTSRRGPPVAIRLRVSAARAATAEDRIRMAAARAFVEADGVEGNEAKDQHTRLTHYETSLALWRQLGNAQQEASILRRMGVAWVRLQDEGNALCYLESASAMATSLHLPRLEAATQIAIASLYANKGDKSAAVDHYRQAYAAYREVHEPLGEARALVGIGLHDASMDPDDALEQMRRAAVLYHEAGDDAGEMYVLNVLAAKYGGRADEQIDALQRSLAIARSRKDRDGQAYALGTLAGIRLNQGDLRAALDTSLEALALFEAAADLYGQAQALQTLGINYNASGNPEVALQYLQRALALRRTLHNRGGEAATLVTMARAHDAAGETALAVSSLHDALALYRDLGDRRGEANALLTLGDNDAAAGQLQSALADYRAALEINEQIHRNIARIDDLCSIGAVQVALHHPDEALRALAAAQELETAGTFTVEQAASVHYTLALAERAAGHPQAALAHARAAVNDTESLSSRVPGADLRTSYVAANRKRYELLVSVLMQLHRTNPHKGYDAQALEASDRARARGLLDLLNESRADLRAGVEPALLEREHALQASLSFKAAYRLQLLSREHTAREASDLEQSINRSTADYEDVERQIRVRSPHYAALMQPLPLSASDMRALLDKDTAMLLLSLGADESYGWLLTRTGLHSYRLPARADVEALARRAYAELSVNDPAGGRNAVAELGRMVLSPIAGRLQARRLVIVPDGALAYIPFPVLPLSSSGEMLMTDHETVELPSASALATLRKELRQRHAAPKAVAVFADPVFRADDPRVAGGSAQHPAAPADPLSEVERSARQSGVITFDRLVATRREAETIVALGGRTHSLEALDFDASREAATSPALAEYRIVHFASHMLLNSRHPELSGIVLSLVDPKGLPQNGFLQVHEIFNLRLNADLVVLSGCQTALGKDVRGEGLVGPVRAFMYAGAPRVVASLWKVPDRATAKLMEEFYAAMLEGHLTPAAALRRAQLALRGDPLWRAPYHWAGFVLQGEWR